VTPRPSISIIIATYTRAPLLDECLQHLSRQQFEVGDEVIVVDNGSTDHTPAVVKRHQARFVIPLRLLHERTPGKSHALAQALAVATGEVLAFLDDDVNVNPDWLATIRDTMSDPQTALMGGRVVPRWDAGVPAWMRVAPSHHARLGAPLGLLEYPEDVVQLGPRTVLGANMAVRREVFQVVGGFAPHLGKLRGTLLSGEDHELCVRVQRAGFRAVYVPKAVVHHWVPAERARVRYFVSWFYWSGITNAILDRDTGTANHGRTLRGLPLYLAKRAAVATLAAGRAMLRGRRDTALHHATDVAFAAGYAAERWGLHT
jgi:GT2 family glycosyltransferase